jgi:glycosyltransferase involved in cell wall biosynthesis
VKTLFIMAPEIKRFRQAEQQDREMADHSPRISLLESALYADVIDGLYLQSLSWFKRFLCKLFSVRVVQAFEVYRRRHDYDAIVSWDDRFAIIYAFLLLLTRSHSRHVAILSWMAPPKKALMLRLVQSHIDRIIVWSQNHRDLLIEFFGISPSKIVLVPYFVDQQFWRSMKGDTTFESICSVGDSKRDYATLIKAMDGLNITCRIVTQVSSSTRGTSDWGITGDSLMKMSNIPDKVDLGPASPTELRAIYARSRFVVLPLFPSFRDHGITTVAEAMSMGKAIICSRTYGLVDFLEDGVNGIFVRPGDPQALREAIQYLYEHPDVAAKMGAEGRRRAEEIFALDHFVANVRQVVDNVITGSQMHIPTMAEILRTSSASSSKGHRERGDDSFVDVHR